MVYVVKMGMKRKTPVILVSIVLVLVIILTQLSTITVVAANSSSEAERAETLIGIAKKASTHIEYLLNKVKETTNGTNLTEAERLYEEGNALLSQAEVAVRERNYGEAVRLTISAMERFREVRKLLAPVLEQAEIELEEEFIKAQGLLVAVNRTIERIACLEKSIPELQAILNTAKNLLNIDEITELLKEENVSNVAHRIAEANRLISQALKSMAEKIVSDRMERFMERLQERYEALIDKLNAIGVNITNFLNETAFKNANEFREHAQQLKESIKSIEPKNAKGLMSKLMSLANGLKKLEKKVESTVTTQPKVEGAPALSVEIHVKNIVGNLRWVFLDIIVKNVGNVRLQFQDSAYGLTIERKGEDGRWEPYYSPIAAQVIVFLEPGQVEHVTVRLNQPQPGEYRVCVRGICEQCGQLIEAVDEFSIP